MRQPDREPNPYIAEYRHSMHRRNKSHDYTRAGFYMLTIVTRDRRPLFGHLEMSDHPYVKLTRLGRKIYFEEKLKINRLYPNVEVWRMCMMPDHIHMIVRVTSDFADGESLGRVVAGFKSGCNRAYWRIVEDTGIGIFEEGYNDRILYGDNEKLKRWKRYLADNPRRLYIKRIHPDLFRRVHDREVAGEQCQLYGNIFLLDIPDMMAVVVHHHDSEEVYRANFDKWMACGERGGVLVSAAVGPPEKAVMREALNRGYSVIWLTDNGFAPMYKPPGEFFDACARGQLLEISPWNYDPHKGKITREQCLHLNALAERLAASHNGRLGC